MIKSRNGLTAAGLSVLGTFLVLLAFTTKSWLVTDGKLKNPEFERLGLWVVCFKGFKDPRHWYDTRFHNCWWVFEEEYYTISDIVFKDFYIATQFFFTDCVFLTVFGLFYTIVYVYLNRAYIGYVKILLSAGILNIAAAICSSIALIIFGVYGKNRQWMPHWEHNDIGWSYGVAVAGTIALYVSGVLYVIEQQLHKVKPENMATQRANYNYEANDLIHSSLTAV
ncbi:uncharacterized protein LOC107883632 [Acyrthosiphon pisum]|uniref:Uncharacterized protein n=1 Tax=Acyrthosiphon pisum TaxID=7029 RepID=A0A8R2D3R3_ACYPI|nr:uncharacterized protein LOC107883632 [Acyrthosiphon pisum]|eukprot:XP_016659524.1 PREDICTED: uncharacterized protein LOC107883632 [Acyrthosiphon pisum]